MKSTDGDNSLTQFQFWMSELMWRKAVLLPHCTGHLTLKRLGGQCCIVQGHVSIPVQIQALKPSIMRSKSNACAHLTRRRENGTRRRPVIDRGLIRCHSVLCLSVELPLLSLASEKQKSPFPWGVSLSLDTDASDSLRSEKLMKDHSHTQTHIEQTEAAADSTSSTICFCTILIAAPLSAHSGPQTMLTFHLILQKILPWSLSPDWAFDAISFFFSTTSCF